MCAGVVVKLMLGEIERERGGEGVSDIVKDRGRVEWIEWFKKKGMRDEG